MKIYEINARVRGDLVDSFERFTREVHIPDLLKTGNFETAQMSEISKGDYRIIYVAKSASSFENYLQNDSKRLREDFTKEFPDGVDIKRTVRDE